MIKDALPEKEQKLKRVHHKMAESDHIGGPTLAYGSPWKNHEEYKKIYNEIKSDKERVPVLEKELEDLDLEASRAGVPLDWRK